jgi:NCS1 family nucleobase:cation symporter-1
MEFATVFVGIIAVLFFGLSFGMALLAILLGNALASLFHGILTSWGPTHGLGQMALGRKAFGFWGNVLPGGLNATLAGMGWVAVNSVSGALALSALTGWNPYLCLVIGVAIVLAIAVIGHNMIHLFERATFPLLTLIFVVGAVIVLAQTGSVGGSDPMPGGFWIAVGACFGYSAGWNPFAADYARYLEPSQSRSAGVSAALGLFVSSTLLMVAGAAAVTAVGAAAWNFDNPVDSYVSLMPGWLGKLTLLAVFIGAISANALNLYSSGLSFATIGISLPTHFARAAISLVVGLVGLAVALFGITHVETFENFLLVTAYWIGPWLGVVLTDRVLHKAEDERVYTSRAWVNWAGPVAMAVSAVVSIVLFSNQTAYVGPLPTAVPGIGDITFEVGFVLAAVLYAVLYRFSVRPLAAVPAKVTASR